MIDPSDPVLEVLPSHIDYALPERSYQIDARLAHS